MEAIGQPIRKLPAMQVSYNKLKTFGECALKYRLAYIERVPRPPIGTLGFQRRLHAALAQYHHFARRDGIVRKQSSSLPMLNSAAQARSQR